jgi:penicillin-binding protein 1A
MPSRKNANKQNKRQHNKRQKTQRPSRKSKARQGRSVWRLLIKWCFVGGLWGLLALILLIAWHARDLPDIAEVPKFERKAGITVLARDGTTLARYGDMKGVSVSVRELPSSLIYAILAIEDRRFYSHYGIDPVGLARAMYVNIREQDIVQGGSTITQQLAKNLFLSHERTIARKIREAILAVWLEHELSKDEILSAYLNRVYFGAGAYGVDAAAHTYFGKSARKLNLAESAILAGLLKAPARLSPAKNPGAARQRARVVLRAMKQAGFIDRARLAGANLRRAAQVDVSTSRPGTSHHRYFTDWVVDNIDNYIGSTQANLVIKTTLHRDLQDRAARAIRHSLRRQGASRNIGQAAGLVMRPGGAVLAMVGGKSYRQSQFNRATHARRPPGSAFKPVVYLTALMQGYTATDRIKDAPITRGDYRPENFSDDYAGRITLRTALAESKNTATVRLGRETGIDDIIATARTLGITAELPRDLSIVLGSAGIPMIELTSAYAMIANGGHTVHPYGITMIKRANGKVLYKRHKHGKGRAIINDGHMRTMRDMLRHAVEDGTGGNAGDINVPVAGKTGTSQNYRDAWFAGFTPEYVGAVWLGNDDNTPMNAVTGGGYPAKIWARIMADAHETHIQSNDAGASEEETGFTKLLNALIAQ